MHRLAIILTAVVLALVVDGRAVARLSSLLDRWPGPERVDREGATVAVIRAAPAPQPSGDAPEPPSEGAPAEPTREASRGAEGAKGSERGGSGGAEPASRHEGAGETAPAESPVLVSIARETWIYAEPRWGSRRLGYLRAGSSVRRRADPATHQSCRRGWYRVEPRGFVCLNDDATLDADHPIAKLSSRRPDMGGLPYLYVTSRYPTPVQYVRLPSDSQQRDREPGLGGHLRKMDRLERHPDYVPPPPAEPVPELLAAGGVLPGLGGVDRGPAAVSLGHARVHSGFALLGTFDHGGRRFGLTTEMVLLPIDRTRVAAPSTMRGVRLSDELSLPVAFVSSRHARRYVDHAESGGLAAEGTLAHRSVVGLTGRSRRRGGHLYHGARDGSWVRADRVRRIDRFDRAPQWAERGEKWIDVSILRQSLVAYEGTEPVFTTLVSTGADGLADHEDSHATIQGTFLIHTKHVSVTMDGDEEGDEFDLRDVPFVQYFTEGYALHGAYWHDDFGRPRSHGCVNLSPVDAAWLFRWSDPKVPEGWHAALSLKKGTIVYIHP